MIIGILPYTDQFVCTTVLPLLIVTTTGLRYDKDWYIYMTLKSLCFFSTDWSCVILQFFGSVSSHLGLCRQMPRSRRFWVIVSSRPIWANVFVSKVSCTTLLFSQLMLYISLPSDPTVNYTDHHTYLWLVTLNGCKRTLNSRPADLPYWTLALTLPFAQYK